MSRAQSYKTLSAPRPGFGGVGYTPPLSREVWPGQKPSSEHNHPLHHGIGWAFLYSHLRATRSLIPHASYLQYPRHLIQRDIHAIPLAFLGVSMLPLPTFSRIRHSQDVY